MRVKKKTKEPEKRNGRPRADLPDVKAPNDFAQWLNDREVTIEQVAKILVVDRATVYGWRRGNRPPSRKMATRIAKMTDGEVSAESWD